MRLRGQFQRADWPLIALSALVLGIYLFYAISFAFLLPYPGIEVTSTPAGWFVNDSTQPGIVVDDVLVQIGELTFEEYRADRLRVPFDGYGPGDTVSPVVTLDGRAEELVILEPEFNDRFRRVFATLWFLPFWSAGTIILLFLRPRDTQWRLLIAFMYSTAIWATLGSIGNWQIGGSGILLAVIQWMMVPIYLHLHLAVPSQLFGNRARLIAPALYATTFLLVVSELFRIPAQGTGLLVLAIAILSSITLLLYRSFRKKPAASDRVAARIMLAGITLAFLPGILAVYLPRLLGFTVHSAIAINIAFIALPALPIFYTYAIYKRQLGAMEFRANRLLSLYSFIIIIPTVFILILLFGEQSIASSAGRTFFLLAISILFAIAAPPLLGRFQHALSRLAYGTAHDPDDILRVFARQIPSALRRDVLIKLITKEITPTLLIKQSVLCLFTEDDLEIVYAEGLGDEQAPETIGQLKRLLAQAGQYRPTYPAEEGPDDWIRLALPLVTRDETIGAWLLGRRDPEDFYPRNDIDLLQTLTNQIAPVIENIRLYEALQEHADNLARQVSVRTSELEAEKDRTQAVLDSAGEGIFFTDQSGVILYTNPEMARTSGYSATDLIGETLNLWEIEQGSSGTHEQMWAAIRRGSDWSGELMLHQKDGNYRDVNLTIAPIQASDGTLSGFVGVQSDISKLKEVDRLKSGIISSVSHELKTPLTTIKTYLMLLRRGKPEKHETYLGVLDRETNRLTNIIVDFLDLSALDSGKIRSRLEPVAIQTSIDEVILSCETRASTREIELYSSIDDSLPRVLADGNQLEQVLMNLIVNALIYTPHGGKVTITAGKGELNEQPAVWFSVADTGPGIPSEDIPYLFERFYRGEVARSSNLPGTGLGLAICKEIIERHSGRITVESGPGAGSLFTVWLPSIRSTETESVDVEEMIPLQASEPSD
jgi:PAS domain S-box-containing protein